MTKNNESDLSNVTVSLIKASPIFRSFFYRFYVGDKLDLDSVKGMRIDIEQPELVGVKFLNPTRWRDLRSSLLDLIDQMQESDEKRLLTEYAEYVHEAQQ